MYHVNLFVDLTQTTHFTMLQHEEEDELFDNVHIVREWPNSSFSNKKETEEQKGDSQMMHSAYSHDHDPPTSFFTCNIKRKKSCNWISLVDEEVL